ncbi:MAG TPA: cyclic nucleotide-binding domain-containing protein [Terriglobales bacterium]|nr:cyclic nucleotide-binding domain-containing protein [Terriglobales bacterium]
MAPQVINLDDPPAANQMFADLPAAVSRALENAASTATYPSGTVLFDEGQSPRGIYLVRRGRVKLSVRNRDGNVSILRIAHAGEVLGLSAAVAAAVTDRGCQATAQTQGDCQVSFIRQSDLLRLMRIYSELTRWVAQQLGRDYDVVGPQFLRLNAVIHNFTLC